MTASNTRLRLLRLNLLCFILLSCSLVAVQASSTSGTTPPPPHRPPPPGAGMVQQQKRKPYVPPPPLKPKQAEEPTRTTKLPPPPPKRTASTSSASSSTAPPLKASIPEQQQNKVLRTPPPISSAKKTTDDALLDRFANKHSSTTAPVKDATNRDPLLERFNKILEDKNKPTAASDVPASVVVSERTPIVENKEEAKEPPGVAVIKPPVPPIVDVEKKEASSRNMQLDEDDDEEEMLLLGEAASVPPPLKRMENLYHQPPPVRQLAAAGVMPPPPVLEEIPRQLTVVPPKVVREVVPPPQQQAPQKHLQSQQHRVTRPQQQQRPSSQQQQEPRPQYRPPQNYQQQQQYWPPQKQQQQQWAQQQQQRRQPPPNRRQPPPQRTSTKTPLLFKSLWQRVEQGLDSLANVEDIVADRASQLTNSVTHRARDLTTKLTQSRDPGRTVPVASNRRGAAPVQQQQGPAPAGKFGAAKTVQLASNTRSASSAPPPSAQKLPASLANLYSGSFSTPENGDSDDEDDDEAATAPVRRKSPWDDVMGADKNKAIRAGSSNPDYSTTGGGAVAGGSKSNLYGRKDSPFMQLQQEHRQGGGGGSGGSNTPPPANTNVGPAAGAAAPPTVQRPFVAARAGPNQQQQQAQATVRPAVSYEDLSRKSSLASRIGGMVPSLPRMPSVISKLLGRGSGSYRDMAAATLDVWKDDEHSARVFSARRLRENTRAAAAGRRGSQEPISATPPLTDLLSRCHHGKSTSLLSNQDLRHCKTIANTRAVLDVGVLALVVLGAHQILSVSELISFKSIDGAVATMVSNLAAASHGWGYFALVAAFLTAGTNFVLFEGQIHGMATSVSDSVRGASQYAQLYMRLVAGQPVDKHVPERMQQAARAQTLDHIQTIRMQTFVTIVLATMLVMTVSVVQPILLSIIAGFYHVGTLPELWTWPVAWSNLGSAFMEISHSVMEVIKDLLVEQFSTYKDNPFAMAFQFSIVAALLLAAFLPTLEHSRKVRPLDVMDEEDEDVTASAFGTVTTLSNLGVSSASRLGLLSKSGALEGTLERWRATLPPLSSLRDVRSFSSSLRRVGYIIASTLALASPVMVYFHCFRGICLNREAVSGLDSIWNVSIMLLFVLRSSWKSISSTVQASNLRPYVQSFVKGLGEVVDEVSGSKEEGLHTQLGSSISSTIGLGIKDLWAAHTSKRAWAVRGATFECQNGEVVAILGDDGAGKSRILTAISEVLVNPSKRSLTTTKVRGTVSIGGLDASKWDRDQLKKRLGIFLNDVRTIADNAEFMSGFTLEEILEPMDGLLSRNPTAGARAVSHALQISGLSTTLIPRLPGKLSTVVTANENELTPSELRPRCYALSPSEWSKLLLTRVLAQTIFDNENISNAPLVGSLLLLDDLTTHLSEEEELKIMQTLRRTGAATVFTSHKWASGRLADRIVIIKDGAVVESGTHNELLARGPQQSMYAAKWHTMTTG